MTVVADEKKCVPLPTAKPGDRFDLRIAGQGKFVLTLLEGESQSASKVKVEKRDGFSVGVLDSPIDPEALNEALHDFP